MNVRVSDERLAGRITHQSENPWRHAGIDVDIALDLRDCRAERDALLAQVVQASLLRCQPFVEEWGNEDERRTSRDHRKAACWNEAPDGPPADA